MAKIAVATGEGGLDDQVSPVFGRCRTFTFVKVEGDDIKDAEVAQNQYANEMGGAGIQAAEFIADQGVEVVIAGNFGPKVTSVLNQSEVKMVSASGMSVKDAVEKYLEGELQPITQATVPAISGPGRGMGRGMGRRMMQQPGQQPTGETTRQPGRKISPRQTKEGEEDRIQNLEDRMKDLEVQLKEIREGLEKLKRE